MKTKQIKNQINKVIAEDKQNQIFANLLRKGAKELNIQLSEEVINEDVQFLYNYLLFVPQVIEATRTSSTNAGIQNLMEPLIEMVENYFLKKE